MTFLTDYQVEAIKGKLVDDKSALGKLYKAKNNEYQLQSVDHSLVDDYVSNGWESFDKPLKTKTKIRKRKKHSKQFEDDIWCQFYDLGYRHLNFDENFILPFSKNTEDTKQIDVIAIDGETIFLIECKSSEKKVTAKLLKDEFDLLSIRLDGFKKALWQIFGKEKKIKYVFATRNLRVPENSIHLERLKKTNSFYYNNSTFDYVNSLIKNYKNAAFYQFLGLVFKNEEINSNMIEIPALKGKMGNKEYYMFSIEPSLLLKMGFILHRTRANQSEFPTYQRLLVPSRLKGITQFIDGGGYFPNSVIINFNIKNRRKVIFESNSKEKGSNSCSGTLKIPNSYGIAYIIDGQHRVYGYANSIFKENNTIPVVGFINLETKEQLEIFMDINENQKAVSPSLRLDLEEDLNWDSERADSRLVALKSSIAKAINSESSPLFNKISVGEDKAILTFKPFMQGLNASGLLPTAKGNKYNEESLVGSLYDTNNHEHSKEMAIAKKKVVDYIVSCYDFVEQEFSEIFNKEKYFIVSNRGTYAFISIIGSLNKFETQKGKVNKATSNGERFNAIKPYLQSLMTDIEKLSNEEVSKQLALLGAGADTKWLRFFQTIISSKHPEYNPPELVDWKERQNNSYQEQGRTYVKDIERHIKTVILNNLKILFGENWELEINSIRTACEGRANDENEKNYKEGIAKRVEWTEMFDINDYKTIIEKNWTKAPDTAGKNFKIFQEHFSINIGEAKNKKDLLKWMLTFNSHRNQLAHEGSKKEGINKNDVDFLAMVHDHFFKNKIL